MKKTFALLLTFVLALTLVGCQGNQTNIGIVLPTRDEPRWLQDEARFLDLLGETDYSVEILFSQGSTATELSNVETLISRGIEVLIITAQDGAAAGAAVERAKEEGITVIAYDRLITETDAVDYYVTFDSIAVGEAQAQYLVDNVTGTGNPLYLYAGAASDNNAFLFFEGAWNVLQPKIADGTFEIINSSEARGLQSKASLTRDEMASIIGQITTNWDFNTAKNLASANLTAAAAGDKGEVFILAPNDGTARAIADEFGSDPASVQYIIDGKQSMTVFKDTRTLAADAIDMAIAVLDGSTVQTTGSYNNGVKNVAAKQTDVVVVTQNNVQAALIDSEYYEASEFTGLS